MSTSSVAEIITNTTSNNTSNNININNTSNTSKYNFDCDKLYGDYKSLCGHVRFKPYYTKMFFLLGKSKVIELASIAKQDKINFGLLLKQEIRQ